MSLQCRSQVQRYRDASEYVVNNSFHCGLQPKRVSEDAHLYMLLHKKILRKAVIEKRFEESLTRFNITPHRTNQGFRGKVLHNFSAPFHKTIKQPQKCSFRIGIRKRSPTCELIGSPHPLNQLIDQRKMWVGSQSISNRPNMMYNLTLYRKSFRRNQAKSKKICLKVVENYNRNKQEGWEYTQGAAHRRIKTIN